MSGVLIMAGGTGGHVFPGLAVARRLRARDVPVAWLGTRTGLEARIVPAAGLGIDMEWLTIGGVRHKGLRSWLALPWRLANAMREARAVLRRRRPHVVLSMGGFVAGPGGLVAWLTRTPLVIHEQNAIPGLTNKWLAPLARAVLTGFPGALGAGARTRHVGNPVRREIAALTEPRARLAGRTGALRLLVVGGSLGAGVFNDVVPQAVAALTGAARPEVWHQCGRNAAETVKAAYAVVNASARVSEFIDDMAAAYGWADLVLCRAGAMTIAELAAAGVAAILVPYPHAVDDHQTANARFLSGSDAAILLPQAELNAARLGVLLSRFQERRELLMQMARAARSRAMLDADELVARICLETADA